jgi:AAA+ superfamily predicted ATPase
MDDTTIFSFETTQPLISELRQQLPRVGDLLGTSADNLAIVDYDRWPKEYMGTDWRDRVLSTHGPLPDMPMLQRKRSQKSGPVGIGMCIYQNRLDETLKYIIATMIGSNGDENFLIVPKDKLFRLKRNAKRLNKESSQITEKPILGEGLLEEVVQNTVGFLLKAKEIEKFGVKIKRGIVLDGSPGNGKTMLCRYVQKLCSQNGISWGVVTSSDIDDAYEDKFLSDLFQMYTVTFFDDIDVAYMDRKKGNGKMACSLLTAMDGMSEKGHLIRIFTTNEPVSELDPAFTRPGRIDKCITLEKPTLKLRRQLVETVWPKEITQNIDVESLLNDSADFSFAELEAIRTFLVTNKTLGDGTWDLKRAFDEFNARRAEKKRRGTRAGF